VPTVPLADCPVAVVPVPVVPCAPADAPLVPLPCATAATPTTMTAVAKNVAILSLILIGDSSW
jgi:hypothetical protein